MATIRLRAAATIGALLLLAAVPATAEVPGSVTLETDRGLHTARFDTDRGTVEVRLPDDLAAGDTLSGTVVARSSGRSPAARERNADRLEGYVIALEDQGAEVGSGAFTWSVSGAAAAAALVLRDPRGREVARTGVPLAPEAGPSAATGPTAPPVGQTGRPLTVDGPFDGRFETSRVTIGGREAPLLAESPRKLVVESPADVVGPTVLVVSEAGTTSEHPFRSVDVRLSAPRTDLDRGERTELTVEVSGLQGLERPVSVRVRNETPSVVRLEGGDTQTVEIAPSAVGPDGRYVTTREIVARRVGSFGISARVETADEPGATPAQAPEPEPQPDSPSAPEPRPERAPAPPPAPEPAPAPAEAEPERDRPVATYGRYRDCTEREAQREPPEDPMAPFWADPEEARERHEMRLAIQAERDVLDAWERLCGGQEEYQRLAGENRERLAAQEGRLRELASQLGVTLPAACSEDECCPGGDCCRGLDPESATDRETFRKRLKCLIGRFRATNRALQEAGSDFSWLLERWEAGADHRAMMGFYDQLFSAVSGIIEELTTSLGDRVKGVLEEQLTAAGCAELGLSEAECRRAREAIETAKSAKGAVDEVTDLVRAGTMPPAFIVKMVDAMARAAGNAARTAVEGWESFKVEMGATLQTQYGHLLCLQAINDALGRQAEDCERFCSAAVEGVRAEIDARLAELERADRASREAAQQRLEAQADRYIDPHLDAATSTSPEDRGWIRACCRGGAGTVKVRVPGQEGELAECARTLEARIKEKLGPLYCHLWDLEFEITCRSTHSVAEVTYTYSIGERRPGCCLWPVETD
jgi:hypothetical protein